MANVIQHRRNTGTGVVPTTGQLAIAELAINTYDGRLWFKANNGSDYLREVATLNGTQTLSNKSIVGGSAIELTAFSVRSSGSAFDVAIASAEVLTADRTLTLSLGDANRTLTLSGNATISGTNTGDQTSVSGNAGTATALATPRAIYGNNFDGSAALTQIIASTYGGTGNGFTKFTGATSTEKTYTLPNATCTILTTNAAVTVAQGGTGATTLTGVLIGNGTSAVTATSILTSVNGGTGNGFTKFSGATTSEKTYTLPDATCTILTSNAAVTVAQGGTGATTLTGVLIGNGTSAVTATSILTAANGGTNNGFTQFSGPTTSAKTFTLPNASATILTDNALVTAAQGGTGNGFTAFSGPASSTKTFTLPNASCTILTTNAAVTVAQGGTGATTLTGILVGNGTSAFTAVTAPSGAIVGTTDAQTLTNKFVTPRISALTDGATPALNASLADIFTLSAAGNRTIAVPTNATSGQMILIIHYASAGARTLALNTGANGFAFGEDVTGLTATTSGKYDYILCQWHATAAKWHVLSVAKGY